MRSVDQLHVGSSPIINPLACHAKFMEKFIAKWLFYEQFEMLIDIHESLNCCSMLLNLKFNQSFYSPVTQSVRVLGLYPSGRGFKSLLDY